MRECERDIYRCKRKVVETNRICDWLFSSSSSSSSFLFRSFWLYFVIFLSAKSTSNSIMSQSATLIRVAKHALDGTPVYPHHGTNTIYYQPIDISSSTVSGAVPSTTTKYLAYAIQRPSEHVVSVGNHTVTRKKNRNSICVLRITRRERERKSAFDSLHA